MCLIITKNKENRKSSSKDIVCYKVLENYNNFYGEECKRTPFLKMHVKNEVLDGKENLIPKEIEVINFSKRENAYYIFDGFIHTLKRKRHAKRMARILNKIQNTDVVVYKCVIPKNTQYYEGKDSNGWPSYASKAIGFVKQLCSYNL